jgi:hypothetical protein
MMLSKKVGMKKQRPEFEARSTLYRRRAVEELEQRKRFLVVCEGENTEPNYFRAFPVEGRVVEVKGAAGNTISVVDTARALSTEKHYDRVWCVFDKDSFPDDRFMGAITRARALGFSVAYSNEAFELWYLLHFDFITAGVSRHEYARMLAERMGAPYSKNSLEMYVQLRPRLATAIRNARKLLAGYEPCRPHVDNPSTTVHLLVQELVDDAD